MNRRTVRLAMAAALVLLLAAAVTVLLAPARSEQTRLTAYFDNSNGIFVGDDVVVLGVKVGEIDRIEPEPQRVKISFWVDGKYRVPADAQAVILSPKLITSRAIQLTPAFTGGPVLADGAVIPLERTAVPVEFDDLRQQLQKLADSLQPTQPDAVSPLGAIITTTANDLRGEGAHIHDTIVKLSQSVTTLGDHSGDVFGTVKNLSTLVSALHDSADIMRQLNTNLAAVSALLSNDDDEVGRAVSDLNGAVAEVTQFVADNREAIGTTSDKLSSITKALVDSLDDIKQTLHAAPTSLQDFINTFGPAHSSITGSLALNNFANPITFLCGAIQAASRLGNEQSAKLCVQYLAPIIKNRQYNFPPLGLNPIVGPKARPNEITYSEDWMRPDHRPSPLQPVADAAAPSAPLPAEAPQSTDPTGGLAGIMVPPGVDDAPK